MHGEYSVKLCYVCFCLSRYYHYLSIVQINPFSPRPSHSATESHSLLARRGKGESGGGGEKMFLTGARTCSQLPWSCLLNGIDNLVSSYKNVQELFTNILTAA
jgi:hypothetical protein